MSGDRTTLLAELDALVTDREITAVVYRGTQERLRALANAKAARDNAAYALAALELARSALATALQASAPNFFPTEAEIAEHIAIKRIDTALQRCRGLA